MVTHDPRYAEFADRTIGCSTAHCEEQVEGGKH